MSSANPKSQEPTMEEILASIRRIIADDQAQSNEPEDEAEEDDLPAAVAAPAPVEDDEAEAEKNSQSAVDDMFDSLGDDFEEEEAEPEPEPEPEDDGVLDLGAVAEPVAKAPREPSPLDLDHEDIDFRDASFEPDPEPEPAFEQDEPEEEPDDEPVEEEEAFAEPPRYVPPPMPEPPPPRRHFDDERLVSEATDAVVGGSFNMLAHAVLANQGRTLDDLVKEMLRPMLKDWLDDNLPTIVERLVRAEIERVSRGR